MTILKVDEETFSIILLALNECGYDTNELEIDFWEECECDKKADVGLKENATNEIKNPKKDKSKKISVD